MYEWIGKVPAFLKIFSRGFCILGSFRNFRRHGQPANVPLKMWRNQLKNILHIFIFWTKLISSNESHLKMTPEQTY